MDGHEVNSNWAKFRCRYLPSASVFPVSSPRCQMRMKRSRALPLRSLISKNSLSVVLALRHFWPKERRLDPLTDRIGILARQTEQPSEARHEQGVGSAQ